MKHCTKKCRTSKNGDLTNLLRMGTYSRGILCKVGTLSATPNILATNGPQTFFKDKVAPLRYQRLLARDRNGITPRAGYFWLDHSSDMSYNGGHHHASHAGRSQKIRVIITLGTSTYA